MIRTPTCRALRIPVISDETRKREKSFWSDLEKILPQLLGVFFNAISTALQNQDSFEFENQLRMADAWHWVSAAETAFGWERGSMMEAFKLNQIQANEIVLNSYLISCLNEIWKIFKRGKIAHSDKF